MSDRTIVETPCIHGRTASEIHAQSTVKGGCFGGSTRELSEFSQEAIEAGATVEWPHEVMVALRHNWTDEGIALIKRQVIKAALAAALEAERNR